MTWPEDWSAATTKTVNFSFDPSLREELTVSVTRAGEAIHCTEVGFYFHHFENPVFIDVEFQSKISTNFSCRCGPEMLLN